MKKALFDQIFAAMKEVGIKPMLGTKTNIKRLPNVKHFGNFEVDGKSMEIMMNTDGPERVLKMFQNESGFIPQMNDQEGRMFLKNINTLRPLINPPENVIPGPGSLEHTFKSQAFKDELSKGRAIWKEMGLDSTTDQGAIKYMKYGDEMKEQGLDSNILEDVQKFMKGKRATNKIIEDEQGVGSLFKEKTDTEVVDVVDDLDTIVKDAGNLQSSIEKLKHLANKMSPEYQFKEEADRKALLKRMYEGKGFGGREGYFRAVTRPFLIDQHEKGIINIPENQLKSLKDYGDLSSGGGMEDVYPDPVRMFRHYYGDEAFELIPSDIDSPAKSSILEAFAKDVNTIKPIKTAGQETGMGYQTKGELLANIEERQKLINDIRRGDDYPITQWSKDEKLETIARTRLQIDTYKKFLDKYYPGSSTSPKSTKLWDLVDDTTGKRKNPWDDFDPDTGGMAQGGRVGLRKGSWPDMGGLIELETEVPDYDMEEVLRLLQQDQYGNQRTLATGGRVGLVKGSGKKGVEFLIKKLNEKLGKDTIKKASDLPKGTKYENLEAVKAFEEREAKSKGQIWEDPVKVRAAVDDIFTTGDYKMDAELAAEALVENNPQVFGNKLIDDIDDITRSKIYGAVLEVVQRDLGKQLQLKRAAKPKSKGRVWKDEKGETKMIAMGGGFSESEMEGLNKAFLKGNALSNAMRSMGMDPTSAKQTMKFDELVEQGMIGFPADIREQIIRAKYGDMVDPRLLEQMVADTDPQHLSVVMGTVDEAMKMHDTGMGPEEIIESIKASLKRKPNAAGGGVGSMFREV